MKIHTKNAYRLASGTLIGVALAALPSLTSAQSTLISDDFEAGNPGYYRNAFAGSVFTTNDSSGIGSGDALQHNPAGNTFRKLIRTFTTTTLANNGDYLDLVFDLRYPSGTPTANSQGFRFGLYNSNGTAPTADGQNVTGNDFGYYSALGTGGTAGRFIFETEANGFLGGGTQNQLNAAGTTTIDDASSREIGFRLERVATGLSIDLSINGSSILSTIDTTPTTYTFDEIALGFGGVSSTDDNYRIDNVALTAIPEPSAFALFFGLSAMLLLGKRRLR